MPKLKAKNAIRINSSEVLAGQEFDASQQDAKYLIDQGAAEEVKPSTKPSVKKD